MLDRRCLALVPFLLVVGACGDDPAPAPAPKSDNGAAPVANAPALPANGEKPAEPKPAEPAPVAKLEPWVGPIDP
ncbi:MAG: murein L,D-transpeptidase, partial [Planctomycetota bacterium]